MENGDKRYQEEAEPTILLQFEESDGGNAWSEGNKI
jgi:hypothetical protein